MRLLIIEDEHKTLSFLKKGFVENGFVVDTASDGETGLDLAQSNEYALIILDILLPKLDGKCVLQELRQQGITTPVIFLTARDSVQDRIAGLELGANDYLVKPFSFSELLARCRNLVHRGSSQMTSFLRIGDMEIDIVRHRVSRQGKRIDLTAKEFALLTLLARRHGEVLSRTIIAEQVWDMNFDSDTNIVDVHMYRLRSKIDAPFSRTLIHTIRGVGYVLEDR